MKILHVITSLQTGGVETLVVNLMPRFRALGHEVGVVVMILVVALVATIDISLTY